MSNFKCEHCGADCIDSPNGYVSGCEHYPLDIPINSGIPEFSSMDEISNMARISGAKLETAMGKRLSDGGVWTQEMIDAIEKDAEMMLAKMKPLPVADDPGLAEIKRMEYLMSKAPCIARLKELADWSEKKY